MPSETAEIVASVLDSAIVSGHLDPQALVDAVRAEFNKRGIAYPMFSFLDLMPFVPAHLIPRELTQGLSGLTS